MFIFKKSTEIGSNKYTIGKSIRGGEEGENGSEKERSIPIIKKKGNNYYI